jgi:hypothetical protein
VTDETESEKLRNFSANKTTEFIEMEARLMYMGLAGFPASTHQRIRLQSTRLDPARTTTTAIRDDAFDSMQAAARKLVQNGVQTVSAR